ncbi:MAG: hypothetical protein K0S19_2167, partial [Geminicoccaceae bacterium]|nr:hypothetical protein [Geminicoccaceae bacterium]
YRAGFARYVKMRELMLENAEGK